MVLLISLPIMIADLKYQKIPNIYLWILSGLLLPFLVAYGYGDLKSLSAYLLLILICHSAGMGMGDLKLLAIIGIWLNTNPYTEFSYLLVLVFAIALIHIFVIIIKNRSIPASIPMAPSIFMALSLYLAAC